MPAKVTPIRPARHQRPQRRQQGPFRPLQHAEPLTDADRKVLRILETAPIRMWPRKVLCEASGLGDRRMRRSVEKLRHAGFPVLSTSDGAGGYWLASTAVEVEEFRERTLHSRLRVIADESRVLGAVAKLMRDREAAHGANGPALPMAMLL